MPTTAITSSSAAQRFCPGCSTTNRGEPVQIVPRGPWPVPVPASSAATPRPAHLLLGWAHRMPHQEDPMASSTPGSDRPRSFFDRLTEPLADRAREKFEQVEDH